MGPAVQETLDLSLKSFEFFLSFLRSETSKELFKSSSTTTRKQFHQLFEGQLLSEEIQHLLSGELYTVPSGFVESSEEVRLQMYHFIKDNDFDRLKDLIESEGPRI